MSGSSLYAIGKYIGVDTTTGLHLVEFGTNPEGKLLVPAPVTLKIPAASVRSLPGTSPVATSELPVVGVFTVGARVRHKCKPSWGVGVIKEHSPAKQDSDYHPGGGRTDTKWQSCPWLVMFYSANTTRYCAEANLELVEE